jgi:hypothetical protein
VVGGAWLLYGLLWHGQVLNERHPERPDGVDGSLLANLVNGILVYYFFLDLPIILILFGASMLTDIMVWWDTRRE